MRWLWMLGLALLLARPAGAGDLPPGAVLHSVQPGETLASLAQRYGVDLAALRAANPEPAPEVVVVPPPPAGWPRHIVVRGQTLWALSRLYGVPLQEIRQANGLQGDTLEVGQQVIIPRAWLPRAPAAGPSGEPPASPAADPSGGAGSPAAAGPSGGDGSPPATGPSGEPLAPTPALVGPPAQAAARAPLPAWLAITLPDGRRGWVPGSAVLLPAAEPLPREQVVALALRLVGTPYRYGGSTPDALDCSGFVQEVYRMAGYRLPRTVDLQFQATVEVGREDLLPGDLVFFETYLPGPSHIGIYLGQGRFLHASSSRGVTVSRLSESYFARRFLGGRRLAEWAAPAPVGAQETPEP